MAGFLVHKLPELAAGLFDTRHISVLHVQSNPGKRHGRIAGNAWVRALKMPSFMGRIGIVSFLLVRMSFFASAAFVGGPWQALHQSLLADVLFSC